MWGETAGEGPLSVFVGQGAWRQELLLEFANRHGLIAGATGTGKTVSLQILAEGFSKAGVPVFMADVKGDLSGLACAGSEKHKLHKKLIARAQSIGFDDYAYEGFPVIFWDVFGEAGHPVRATVAEMGPILLSRLLELNDTQEGVMNIAFRIADDEGLALLDLKDLRALVQFVGEHRKEIGLQYGNVSPATIGAIQRRLLVLENQGADLFFGEPALALSDLMLKDGQGRGAVNILAADKLVNAPRLYSTFLLWLLSELFEELPEVGDPEKPHIVFFFDEAHLLFDDAPKALIDKVEQVVRLIRSKGVGVFFITQNPLDVPDEVLGQLGSRVQHALRAFTPRDQRAVRAAADTFRPNPDLDVKRVITELGVGEALVSLLEDKGVPGVVDQTMIRPPSSRIGPANKTERKKTRAASPVAGKYDNAIDRVSAYETLAARAKEATQEAEKSDVAPEDRGGGWTEALGGLLGGASGGPKGKSRRRGRQSVGETFAKSVARTVGSQVGRSIIRGVLGGLFRGR